MNPDPNYQVGGDHYRTQSIQPWEAMEAWMSPEQFTGFLRGNVIRYIARYERKGGIEDLEKGQHYLSKLIDHLRTIESTKAYCWANGEIGFGKEVPKGALLLAMGPDEVVREKVLSLAEHTRDEQESTAKVPGFSDDHKANLEAVATFRHNLSKLVETQDAQHAPETKH